MKKKFYITTPIYYPNDKPHIGSVYSTLIADIIARYKKIMGEDVVFLTGLDEHGQKVFESAEKNQCSPQKFVDALAENFQSVFKMWDINYTIFMRTSSQSHKTVIQKWISNLLKRDLIYKSTYKGWYSTSSESFILEKDIETKNEAGIPLCPITNKPSEWVEEEAYFFRLSKFQTELLEFFSSNPKFIIPKERTAEVISFIKGGLRDLCISRSKKNLSWGIPFPNDDGHIVYVWADALNNYITGIGYLDDIPSFNQVWPCNLHVMAKDILKFHAVYWIAFLMASDLPLPKNELVHGWLLVDNQKISKSLGNIIDPVQILSKYDKNSLRYYFASLSYKDDVTFSSQEIEKKHNSNLCNTISNLFQRATVLARKKNISTIFLDLKNITNTHDEEIIKAGKELITNTSTALKTYNLSKITELIMSYGNILNTYFHDMAPWKEKNEQRFLEVIGMIHFGLHYIFTLLSPIIPSKIEELKKILQFPEVIEIKKLQEQEQFTFVIPQENFPYIFKKYTTEEDQKNKTLDTVNKNKINKKEEKVEKEIKSNMYEYVSFQDFTKNIILVGKIEKVEDIPKSSKLYYLTVNFGSYGTKQIASGIKKVFEKIDLLNKKTIFAFNIPPRNLCGITSEGMILMPENNEGIPSFITIEENINEGTRLK